MPTAWEPQLVRELVDEAVVHINLCARDVMGVFSEIAEIMSAIPALQPVAPGRIIEAFMDREGRGTTVLPVGLATPHITFEELGVQGSKCAVAWMKGAARFPFGFHTTVVAVCVVGPARDYLARVAMATALAADESVIKKLRSCDSDSAFRAILREASCADVPDIRPESGAGAFIHTTARVVNHQGLHARPVMRLVDLVTKFKSKIEVRIAGHNTEWIDAASAMSLMMLPATFGMDMEFRATGEDAAEAIRAMELFVAGGFGGF